MIKNSILVFFLFALFLPGTAGAQFDQRCWEQQACKDADGIFYQGSDSIAACGEKNSLGDMLGFCTAAGDAETAVSFGGQTRFTNIGTFISFIYRYGVIVAGVLAVIMMIVAGGQWILSAGSPERISSAKKRIAGASVGVLIAVLSYVILNTINPYLVNLRLPQVWMINRQGLAPPYCHLIKNGKISYAGNVGDEINRTNALNPNLTYAPVENVTAQCGAEYFVDGTGGQTCLGSVCQAKYVCAYDTCQEGTLRGIIKNTNIGTRLSAVAQNKTGIFSGLLDILIGFGAEGWEYPWAETQEFYVICTNGDYDDIPYSARNEPDDDPTQKNDVNFTQIHWIIIPDSSVDSGIQYCQSRGGVRGFAYSLEFNEDGDPFDERHLIGQNPDSGEPVDLGRLQSEMKKNVFSKDCINKYLFTAKKVKEGIPGSFDINVDRFCDIDPGVEGENLRKSCYGNVGASKGFPDLGYEKTPEQCGSST